MDTLEPEEKERLRDSLRKRCKARAACFAMALDLSERRKIRQDVLDMLADLGWGFNDSALLMDPDVRRARLFERKERLALLDAQAADEAETLLKYLDAGLAPDYDKLYSLLLERVEIEHGKR